MLHLEIQNANDGQMAVRMLRYHYDVVDMRTIDYRLIRSNGPCS